MLRLVMVRSSLSHEDPADTATGILACVRASAVTLNDGVEHRRAGQRFIQKFPVGDPFFPPIALVGVGGSTDMNRTLTLTFCALAYTGAFTVAAFGDSISQATVEGKVDDAVDKLTAGNPITAGGTWKVSASANDSNGTHPKTKSNSGSYTNTDGSGTSGENTDTGKKFEAKSEGYISWNGKTWASKGTGSLNQLGIRNCDRCVTEGKRRCKCPSNRYGSENVHVHLRPGRSALSALLAAHRGRDRTANDDRSRTDEQRLAIW